MYNVLFEMFTNSHCPLCPNAHASFESYLANGINADKINFVFYHMVYPYSDDPINNANREDPMGRNNYYGPYTQTPVPFLDGEKQATNYSQWANIIEARFSDGSPVLIELSGTTENGSVKIDADVTFGSNVPAGEAVIHFIITESIIYAGRNGVTDHKNAMRKMITEPTGQFISTSGIQRISKSFDLDNSWDEKKVNFLVFIQNHSSREVYQSASMEYSSLILTDIYDVLPAPIDFALQQNYPNPFNPDTIIEFSIPADETSNAGSSFLTELNVYDVLGRKVRTLVDDHKLPGNYSVRFKAGELPGGVYFYKLTVGNYVETRKMTLLK